MNFNKFKKLENEEVKEESGKGKQSINLGNGSEVIYIQKFIGYEKSWEFFDYLNKHVPWIRPTIRVFGRQCLQVKRVFSFVIVFIKFRFFFCFGCNGDVKLLNLWSGFC